MSTTSAIEWTDKTWNPVRGCSVISPGCVNCYAMKQAHRFSTKKGPAGYFGLTKQPAKVFVNSMSDLFHEDVPDDFILSVFAVMFMARRHTFQILTKRSERMRAYLTDLYTRPRLTDRLRAAGFTLDAWPLPNVWQGVSVENRDHLKRIDDLKDTPAAVHFVSFEPLLEDLGAVLLDGIEWAILGGESGPRARECSLESIRSLVRQCRDQNVAPFVKQLGARPTWGGKPLGYYEGYNLKHKKGGDMAEWPEDLRVREFPRVAA
jgi:protein gp37